MLKNTSGFITTFVVVCFLLGSYSRLIAADEVSFLSDIQPLLLKKCGACHGETTRKADLKLTTATGIAKGGESGELFVPREPDKSLIYEKIVTGEMPPDEKDRLSDAEIERIELWIRNGPSLGDSGEIADATKVPSQHDVIPIMLRRCAACHGRHQQLANLDLRTKVSMLTGGKSGPAINLGKPNESLLLKKIHAGEMPPLERLVEVSVKPIESGEIEVLAKWIAAGAPEVAIEPDVAAPNGDALVSDEDRNFWAFRAPQPVEIPSIRNVHRVRNEIDAFILQKLESKGLSLNDEADRLTLMRRATIDLTGLPPEPADANAFLEDSRPDAYERLIDRLLDSSRYGERWGRNWLDAAGYADSEGKREQDLPRPYAWRYRDYVIRSLNADKPFDRFLLEQIAGDELADYEHASEITQDVLDDPLGLPVNGVENWDAGFLSPMFQGTRFRTNGAPVLNLKPDVERPKDIVQNERLLISRLDALHRRERPGQSILAARIASYELAARMQLSASDALDLSKETQSTLDMYGIGREPTDSYGRRCLMARRLVERGVRFVQLFVNGNLWDHHTGLASGLKSCCDRTDLPIAGLLQDLKQRGLFDSTLVAWGSEFGRLPIAQLSPDKDYRNAGRDHNKNAFSVWFAGAGIRGGTTHGTTDDLGLNAVEDRVSVPDWHATMLHLLGLDHEQLFILDNGLKEKLTGVQTARVVKEIFK